MANKRVSTDRFVAGMCRQSFCTFFTEFWKIIAAEELKMTWYIEKLCNELQVLAERVFLDKPKEYDLVWNCPPGTTKSSVLSIAFQPWIWTRMPSARVISGSHSERLALDLSRKSRDIVQSDKYRALFPEVQLREDQNAKGYFANTAGGIRYAVGVGGSVIGFHSHFILVDDPLDPAGALSDLMLLEANNWTNETLSRRKVHVMLTPTALIMQRLHQDDPTGNMLARGTKVKHVSLPCDTTWDVIPEAWREFYVDGLLAPQRYPPEGLEDAKRELGEAGYAAQMGMSPIPRGGAKFKVDRLSYLDKMPTRKWKKGPVRFWDKAASIRSGCFTVGTKESLDEDSKLWITDVVRGQWDSGTREKIIVDTAKADGKSTRVVVEQEPGSGGKESAEATVRRLTALGFRCTLDKVTGDKELRADVLSQKVNLGDVIILKAPWNKEFIEELRFFPVSKYKDQVDSAAGAASALTQPRLRVGGF